MQTPTQQSLLMSSRMLLRPPQGDITLLQECRGIYENNILLFNYYGRRIITSKYYFLRQQLTCITVIIYYGIILQASIVM